MNDVYKALANHLDNLPGGFPATEDGLEIRILKRLFTEEEAELATYLTMMPETPKAIATRAGKDEADLALRLEEMAKKGLIFRKSKGSEHLYSAAMFVVGIWEYQVNGLDADLVRDVNAYLPLITREVLVKTRMNHMRVVPVSKTIAAGISVSSYEDAEEIIRSQSKIVVQPCICRREHHFVGERCKYPEDVCLSFGAGAYYYEANGIGRSVSVDEALAILQQGRDAGLVIQPGNAQKPTNICMCCGCCCQILKNVKSLDKPAEYVHSNYIARVMEAECVACGLCAERCHMDAISVGDVAWVNPDRCIGCGLCVPTCPTGAMTYNRKDAVDQYVPPVTVVDTYVEMARKRGKL
ncbi:MAG: 4Fe-4S binding protein [Thermodesulfobacteriota bacterium]